MSVTMIRLLNLILQRGPQRLLDAAELTLHAGQKVWDYAAGALIAEEAGARLATLAEDDFWSGPAWSRSVIAARTPALFEEWKRWVRERLQSP